jgi:AcrR family transcriptional regulator
MADGASTHYDRKLEGILRQAAAVFCERGYHQASIRDISRATGVSLAGLYYYFSSKEQLLYLIQRHTFETLIAQARAVLASHAPESRLDRTLAEGSIAPAQFQFGEIPIARSLAAKSFFAGKGRRNGAGAPFRSLATKANASAAASSLTSRPLAGKPFPPEQRLRAFIRLHLEYFIAHPNEMKVLTHEERALADKLRRQVHALKKAYYQLCFDQLEALKQARRLAGLDTRVAALSLFGMMNWIYTWYKRGLDPHPGEMARQMTEIFLHGVFGDWTRRRLRGEAGRSPRLARLAR